ncbi:MAG: TIM barrel protein [Chloroflexota bacterium]|nr:sugar phosphate isomerase/epimerase [Chloroflexota bacterium]
MSEDIDFEAMFAPTKKKSLFNLAVLGDEIAPELDEQLDHMEQEGIRFLEVRRIRGENILDLTNTELNRVSTILKERGISVSSVASSVGKVLITEPFEPQFDRFKRALEVADWLGSSYVRVFSFYMPPEEGAAAYEKYRPEVMRRMTAMAQETTPWGMILLHENEKGLYGDTAARCADILDTVGSTNLRALFDPANFVHVRNKPFTDAYPLLSEQITYLHIKDAYFSDDTVTIAGAGEAEVEEVLRALWQNGYQGFLSLEPHLEHNIEFSNLSRPERFHEAARALKAIVARIEQGE